MADNNTRIILTAEDRTSPVLASVTGKLGAMQQSATLASSALAAIGVSFSGAAMVAFVKGTIDAADGFNDLAQRIGIGIKELAGWTLAANQSGTSMESVAKGVKGLSQYMVEHGDKLRAAGITATNANGSLIQLADLFKGMPDGVEKTALAVQLFGKAGMDMIPMLNMGSAGLAEAQEKAAEYGQRMAELAPHADRFNDLLAEMAFQSKVTGINIGLELVPPMIKFLEQLQEGKKIAGGWLSAMWEFGVVLDPTKGIPENLKRTREELEKLNAEMARGMKENQQNGGLNDLSDIERGIGSASKRKQFLEFMQRQQAMENAAKFGDYRDARDLSLTTGSTMARARGLLNKSGGQKVQGPIDVFGSGSFITGSKAVAESIRASYEFENWAQGQLVKEAQAMEDKARAMDEAHMARMEAARIESEGEEAIREAMEKTNAEMAKQKNMADDLGFTFASAFEDAVIGARGLQAVLGGLAQDVARIFMRKTITEPMGNALASMFKNFSFSDIFGGARANGGPVESGTAYLVGERGPELFIPGTSGHIQPNAAAAGSVRIEVVNPPGRPAEVASATPRMDADGMVVKVVLRDIATSGPIAGAIASQFGLNRAVGAY